MQGKSSGFDPGKDKVLFSDKVKREEDGYEISLRSYDGHEPRLKLHRAYRDRDGQWKREPEGKFPRLPFYVVRAIVQRVDALDKAFAEWEGGAKDLSDKEDDKIPF